ncbi:MAG: hypothetical protein ABSF45_22425 [Terriglobia bacterium]
MGHECSYHPTRAHQTHAHARLQILTIAELLAGKKLEYPAHRVETFAKAARKIKHEQDELFLATPRVPA